MFDAYVIVIWCNLLIILMIQILMIKYTSITAQGGGTSFKDRTL